MRRELIYAAAYTCFFAGMAFGQGLSQIGRQFEKGAVYPIPAGADAFNAGTPIQPLIGISPELFPSEQSWYVVQHPSSLGHSETPRVSRPLSLQSQLRKNAAPFLRASDSSQQSGLAALASRGASRELNFALALMTAMYRAETPAEESKVSGPEFSLGIRQRISADPGKLLEIVESEVTAHPTRVCEIVKAAIRASGNDENQVALIVETAAVAAPEQMRLAAQCAVAAVPESLAAVQAVLSELDPAGGNDLTGSKSGKDSKDAKGAIVSPELAPHITPFDPLSLPPPPPPIPPIPPPVPPSTNTSFRYFGR